MKAIATTAIAAAYLSALVLANYWIARNPPDTQPIVSARGREAAMASADKGPDFPPPPQLTHSLTRPLFLAGRRPWAEPAKPAQQPAAAVPAEQPPPARAVEPLEVSLTGVQKDPGGTRALIRAAGHGEFRWVRQGESVGGWTVSAIGATSVEFVAGNETLTVELYSSKPASQSK